MNTLADNKLPVTRIQKLIGKLMLQSKRQKPSCYLEINADLTDLVKMRKSYCKTVGLRITTNDFFFAAIAAALKKFPLMAGKLDPTAQSINIPQHLGIGFAVAAPQGLVAPVIKNVTEKSLPQIAAESNELLRKARANKLTLDDLEGADVNFTSLAMYGVTSFFAIIPPDATGIISIGKFSDTVVPVDGELTVRKIMSVTLAVDTRIVEQFYAAQFLNCLVHHLQNPITLTQ